MRTHKKLLLTLVACILTISNCVFAYGKEQDASNCTNYQYSGSSQIYEEVSEKSDENCLSYEAEYSSVNNVQKQYKTTVNQTVTSVRNKGSVKSETLETPNITEITLINHNNEIHISNTGNTHSIYRKQSGESSFVKVAETNKNTYIDNTFTKGNICFYKVKDANGVNTSKFSNEKMSVADKTLSSWYYNNNNRTVSVDKIRTLVDNKPIVYYLAEVSAGKVNTAWSNKSFHGSQQQKYQVGTMCGSVGAVLGINGDAVAFKNADNSWLPSCCIRNGKAEYEFFKNPTSSEVGGQTKKGKLIVFNPNEYSSNNEIINKLNIQDTWFFNCAIVTDGKIKPYVNEHRYEYGKTPSTALGQRSDGTWLFLVADGRGKNGSQGASFYDMAKILVDNGASTAIILDGGGSSTMYFAGTILNSPSDGIQRRVDNMIFV